MEQKRRQPKTLLFVGLFLLFMAGIVTGQFVKIDFKRTPLKQNSSRDLNYSSVEEAFDTLVTNFDGQLRDEELIEGLKKGLAEATKDPYTEYFTNEESKEFNEQVSGSFTGIGAELGKEDNAIVVIAPLKGYPAEAAGLRAKDIIIKIDNEDALSLSVSEAVKKIRGPKDTSVKLDVIRGNEQLEFAITRAEIKIPSVEHEVVEGGICNIRISRFSDDTDTLVKKAISECKSAQVTSVLLDLRNNPGGYLDQAIKVASHWVNNGDIIVSEKRGGVVFKAHKANTGQELAKLKTVILVNEGSASASEIVAGALKDYGLATLVGTKTYGKGSVQEVDALSNGTSIKITVARWFTPLDKNIDKEGIEPDIKVELSPEQTKALTQENDPQLQKAFELLQ